MKLNQILYIVIGFLVFVLISGTIAGISNRNTNKDELTSLQKLLNQGQAVNLNAPVNTDEVSYFEFSSIRIVSKPEKNENNGVAFVITPWLAYPQGDTVFYEELSKKRTEIRKIFSDYFSTKTKKEILERSEEKITKELISLINERLSLGKIRSIYFTNYIFLE
ncbi:MAG: flagellar basal body-associated FliL family protein [Treponema sp.]|nr:flagellar basal body-associated FliL family protein [Spirochaetia bacterium]MDY5123393.1 flagellar basal body-associated FliL family protein [Treponema sp.]